MKGVIAFAFVLLGIEAFGATFVSKKAGAWTKMSTWDTLEKNVDHFTPEDGDDVVIRHDVSYDETRELYLNSIRIEIGKGTLGTLRVGLKDEKNCKVSLNVGTMVNMNAVLLDSYNDGSTLKIGKLVIAKDGYVYLRGKNGTVNIETLVNDGELKVNNSSNFELGEVENNGLMVISENYSADVAYAVCVDKMQNNGNIRLTSTKSVLALTGDCVLGVIADYQDKMGKGRVELCGKEKQTIKEGECEVQNIVIDNENGVEAVTDMEVTGKLTMKRGVLKMAEGKSIYLSKKEDTEGQLDASGCGETCYVDGLMYRYLYLGVFQKNGYNRADALYPVGNGGKYGRARVSASRSRRKVGVRYVAETAKRYEGGDEQLWASLGNEYWHITRDEEDAAEAVYVAVGFTDQSDMDKGDEGCRMTMYKNQTWTAIEREVTAEEEDGMLAYKNSIEGSEGIIAMGYTDRKYWIGRTTDINDIRNWPNGEKDDEIYIQDGCEYYPIITKGDEVKPDYLSIYGKKAKVILDGGVLDVRGRLRVSDNEGEGHVEIRNRYDRSSAFRCGETDYKKFAVERTFRTNTIYYTGTATKEGAFVGDIESDDSRVKDGMINLNVERYDRLSVYDPVEGKYEKAGTLKMGDDYVAGTLGLVKINGKSERKIRQVGALYGADEDGIFRMKEARDGDSWNCIVNPYMYSIPTDKIALGDGLEKTMWIRHYDSDARKYIFSTYNFEAGISVSQGERITELAPQQSFCLLRKKGVSDESATLRYMGVEDIDGGRLKNAKVQSVVRVKITAHDCEKDEMAIVIREDEEAYDSRKNEETTGTVIYAVKEDGRRYAIPFVVMSGKDSEEVEIGVRLDKEGEALIEMEGEEDSPYIVTMTDRETGLGEDGTLAINGEGVIEGRIKVRIERRDSPKATDIKKEGLNEITVRGGSVIVKTDSAKDATMTVYDMEGRVVARRRLDKSETNVTLGRKRIYVVEIAVRGVMTRKKIMTQ